ncbi:MAG: insulinase family protein, partial [Gammaproteobacteria bacterium]|nr:insulinase family protein [Gammaproteobacteria bacterium]
QDDFVIRQSPNDDRNYRYFILENELRVLVVSDPETDKAAASLVVLRGQNHDPEEFGGLAHFLEHMLFIGTEKYPAVDEYQRFIAANGGSSNAYTAADHTNYFFDIHPDYFEEGLDRFAQFFINPLLDPAYVEREKNAVHSEYQLQIKDDGWRGFAAIKAAMNPAYPGARFHIGSLDTLGEGVDEALAKFREQNYSSDQMILVALSNEPLDTIESWIRTRFKTIENRHIGPAAALPSAFLDNDLPLTLTHRSLKDSRRVTYNFPVPATQSHYRQKPAAYINNLLGHEGHGSLHQSLKSAGWIEGLAASSNNLDPQNTLISIDIQLTDEGAKHIEDVTNLLFAYIDLLKTNPPQAWRYAEQARVAELGFRFQEKSSATGFVYRVGPMLDLYPPEYVLSAPYLMEDFDPRLINEYINLLNPDNLVMEIVGPDVETDQVEPWFNVPYRVAAGTPTPVKPTDASLALPAENQFLPQSLDLLSDDEAGPRTVLDKPTISFWLDRDTEFGVPRANVFITLGLPGGLATPTDIVMAQLYQRLLTDSRNELTYPAMLAGLSYRLSVAPDGFRLRLAGYNDKQDELLAAVLDNFTQINLDPDKFAVHKAELVREWRDFKKQRPYTQTYATLAHLLLSSSWPPSTLADVLAVLTVADLNQWREEKLQAFNVVGFAHGNVDETSVANITALIEKNLPTRAFDLQIPDILDISESMKIELSIDHQDASMVLYVQDSDSSFEQRARSAFAVQLLRQPYFTSLRTEQQLGYVVAVTNRLIRDRGGITFIIQSPVASPADLEAATRSFMREQLVAIAEMPDDEFERNKAGLITRLLETDKNLGQRSQRYWADLDLGVLTFDSQAQIAAILTGLDKPAMLKFINGIAEHVQGKRLLIYNLGKFAEAPIGGTPLTDVMTFKRG